MTRTSKTLFGICILTFLLTSIGWAKPRVAVMDFENKTQHGGWRLGRGAADILTTEMVKIGKFDMFERDRLQSVIKEQDLGVSGRVDPSTAARIGKIIGVSYIITGAVTEYGRSRSDGGGGGVRVGKTGYHSAVDVRMVDAATGRIVFAESASKSKASVNVKVFGFGGGEKFNEKLAAEAMREAVQEVADKVARAEFKTAVSKKAASGQEAVIADVEESMITLNKGRTAGLKNGQILTIKRKGKVIKDPATGKVLKIKYRTVGKIKLTSVEEGYSEGTVISGSDFKIGDVAR
jgi:curli biogenesis system outer membrane secretion channel CsgG